MELYTFNNAPDGNKSPLGSFPVDSAIPVYGLLS